MPLAQARVIDFEVIARWALRVDGLHEVLVAAGPSRPARATDEQWTNSKALPPGSPASRERPPMRGEARGRSLALERAYGDVHGVSYGSALAGSVHSRQCEHGSKKAEALRRPESGHTRLAQSHVHANMSRQGSGQFGQRLRGHTDANNMQAEIRAEMEWRLAQMQAQAVAMDAEIQVEMCSRLAELTSMQDEMRTRLAEVRAKEAEVEARSAALPSAGAMADDGSMAHEAAR